VCGSCGRRVCHPETPIHRSVARETVETVWAPHASYALAVLRAASPGVAGRGGAQFSSVSSVQFSSVHFIAVQVRSGQFSSDIACTHARMHWLPTAVHCRMSHGRTPARTARRSRRLLQPLRPCWRALSPGSLTLPTTRSCSRSCSLTNENKCSTAILLPNSARKRPRQHESTAAKSWSSSIRRDETRREAAAGIQQQQPASSSTNAMHHVEACAHQARRWPTCDVTVALAPGTAAQRASSTPRPEDLRSERPRPRPKAKKASDIARQTQSRAPKCSKGCKVHFYATH